MGNSIKLDGEWKNIILFKQKVDDVWSAITVSDFYSLCASKHIDFGGVVDFDRTIEIYGAEEVHGQFSSYVAILDYQTDITTAVTWSIVSGSEYATLSQDGELTVLSGANNSSVVIKAEYEGVSQTKELSLTYQMGKTVHTVASVVTDESGNTETTVEITKENSDGSFEGVATTYDENGMPISGANTS